MKRHLVVYVIILTVLLAGPGYSHLYMQPFKLRDLFVAEEPMIWILETIAQSPGGDDLPATKLYLERVAERRRELPLLVDFAKQEEHFGRIMDSLVGNPLHVYNMVNRYVSLLAKVRSELANIPRFRGIETAIFALLKQGDNPGLEDLDGVMLSLARVQFTYRLDPIDLAKGNIMGVQTEAQLRSSDLVNIALHRYEGRVPCRPGLQAEYALAYEWAEAAHRLLKETETSSLSSPAQEKVIADLLAEIKENHNKEWKPSTRNPGNLPNEEFFIDIIEEETGRTLREKEAQVLENQFLTRGRDTTDGYNIHDFYALCRGERINMGQTTDANLTTEQRCYFTHNNNPAYMLSPLKLEVLSADPPVLVYHEVLSKADILSLQHHGTDKLTAAGVYGLKASDGSRGTQVTSERVQSSGWLWDFEHSFLYDLSKQVEGITGLKVARPSNSHFTEVIEAEAWQVGVYGPGGHYLPHYDTLVLDEASLYNSQGLWVGNRMSTAMFYLSSVVGGATAFPKLGIAARPRAGSLVYWHSLDTDGSRDDLSLHGACPTALGLKWVSNKWIREGAQIWSRNCNQKTSLK